MREIELKGLRDLNDVLTNLPKRLESQAVRSGLTAAAAVVRDEARTRAPRETGKMAKSIRSGSPRRNEDGNYSISVRLTGEHAFLGVFHEYGVAPHLIARTGAGQGRVALRKAAEGAGSVTLRPMKIGNDFVSGIISHPGHAAHPFMRPALDTKAEEAIQAFARRVREVIEGKTGLAVPIGEAA